jgi:hypothetical protein
LSLVESQNPDIWSEPQPSRRWIWVVIVIALLGGVCGVIWIVRDQARGTEVSAASGRLSLAQDDGGNLGTVDRQSRPEMWYRVSLNDAPIGKSLPLVCEWTDPAGKVVHRNRYSTRRIDRANWPTHARCRFGPDSTAGTWTVKLLLDGRVLHSLAFEVTDVEASE